MKKFAAAAILAGTIAMPTAMADSDLYLTGGLSQFSTNDADLTAINVRGGLSFHEILGAEFDAAFGIGAEEIDGGSGVELEVENQFSGFLVGRYPVARNTDVLARIGYTTGELQRTNSGVSGDAETDGFAFGIGGEYMFTEQFGIRGDYTRIEAEDDQLDGGIDVFAIAGVFKFGELR